MKIDWDNLNLGGKLIVGSTAVAVVSMFMSWVDIGIISQSGFGQQAFFFLVFYVYPILKVLKNVPISKLWGLISSIGAVVITYFYIDSKSVAWFGSEVDGAGTGAYLFLFASIALVIGVVKYHATSQQGEINNGQ